MDGKPMSYLDGPDLSVTQLIETIKKLSDLLFKDVILDFQLGPRAVLSADFDVRG
jgi:hypothetical protein